MPVLPEVKSTIKQFKETLPRETLNAEAFELIGNFRDTLRDNDAFRKALVLDYLAFNPDVEGTAHRKVEISVPIQDGASGCLINYSFSRKENSQSLSISKWITLAPGFRRPTFGGDLKITAKLDVNSKDGPEASITWADGINKLVNNTPEAIDKAEALLVEIGLFRLT